MKLDQICFWSEIKLEIIKREKDGYDAADRRQEIKIVEGEKINMLYLYLDESGDMSLISSQKRQKRVSTREEIWVPAIAKY